ncbi:hypothetical protein HELRODRAFT_107834 [Helobdella robusta]|uniref:Uncharacterized protein n=1 Tax=Helobdella robusta TaxID=6412 RepID=T1EED2_HELRO|nr:hypothetical protein HELRODRAFT_107834 [Helobdella robusta]ESN94565.1 hypothetical protein HELRODRAFT_107834 [Helobdella robusta]
MKSVATSTASSATVKPSPAMTPTSTKAATNSLWIKKASSMLAPSMHNKPGVTPVKKVDTMNKSLMCKPIMLTKATACNPMRIHKSTQTDEEVIEHKKTTIVPIPVPVLIPAPITPCVIPSPYPIPTPVPVPVPCMIPATRENVQLLMRGLQDLYNKSITNPLEAELLDMAEVISSTKSEEDIQNEAYNATIVRGVNDQNYIYPGTAPSTYKYRNGGEDVLEMAMRVVADMPEDQTGATNISKARVPGYLESSRSEMAMMSSFSNRGGPTKRANIYNSSQQLPLPFNESKVKLKYSYALKAWRSWAEQKNHDNSKTAGASRGRVRFFFDPDPLKLSYEELNAALSMFVRDVRKPTGEKYAPDSIYYMCLGLQYYLRENGRQDNIFFDVPYQKFTDVLNELMSAFELRLNTENMLICRVIEDHLWESKQLGCHTPQTLLNTLIYFNTKHFLLDSVDAHMNLSFAAIERGSDKTTDGQIVKKITLKQAVSFRELKTLPEQEYTQHELPDDPARCPVKLFDFYLSRCPEVIRQHSRLFYLTPELSSRPENPIWFSTMALSRGALNKMINRVKVVREIQVARLEHMQFEA